MPSMLQAMGLQRVRQDRAKLSNNNRQIGNVCRKFAVSYIQKLGLKQESLHVLFSFQLTVYTFTHQKFVNAYSMPIILPGAMTTKMSKFQCLSFKLRASTCKIAALMAKTQPLSWHRSLRKYLTLCRVGLLLLALLNFWAMTSNYLCKHIYIMNINSKYLILANDKGKKTFLIIFLML